MKNMGIREFLLFYYEVVGARVLWLVPLVFIAGLLESLGIVMLIPLFERLDSEISEPTIQLFGYDLPFGYFFDGSGVDVRLVIIGAVMVSFIAKALFIFFVNSIINDLEIKVSYKLKTSLIGYFEEITPSDFYSRDSEYYLNLVNIHIENAVAGFQALVQTMIKLLMASIYGIIALTISWFFGVMSLVSGGLILVSFIIINRRVREESRKVVQQRDSVSALLIQIIQGYKYLKITGTLGSMNRSLNKEVEDLAVSQRRLGRYSIVTNTVQEPIIVCIIGFILITQLVFISDSLSSILVSVLLFYRALAAILQIQGSWQAVLSVSGALTAVRSMEVFRGRTSCKENRFAQPIRSVQMEKCNFSFRDSSNFKFTEFSIDIARSDGVVVITGPSGSGKSTLVELLLGYRIVQSGVARLGDLDASTVNPLERSRAIGYLPQEPVIFNGLLHQNITLNFDKQQISDAQRQRVWDCLSMVRLDDYVRQCDAGVDMDVGEGGNNLSGGQRQRLALARELFKSPEILVLDEATSAMDSMLEEEINGVLAGLKKDTLLIMIAHRPATIRSADRIIVLENGRVVADGSAKAVSGQKSSLLDKIFNNKSVDS